MALPTYALPYGLRDLKVRPIDAAGAVGSSVDLPASRTFSFKESESETELRGDDQTIASRGSGPLVTWSLEGGGISLDVFKILAGGTVTTTGVTPNLKKTYKKLGTDSRPYFQVEGQSISDNGGDVHGIVYKCKADGDIGGDMADQSWYMTACSGKGYADASNNLYDFVQNETAAAII